MLDKLVNPEFEKQLKEKLSHLPAEEDSEVEILAKAFCQYEITEKALVFISDHPKTTVSELWDFFDVNTNGLAPGDDGDDLKE